MKKKIQIDSGLVKKYESLNYSILAESPPSKKVQHIGEAFVRALNRGVLKSRAQNLQPQKKNIKNIPNRRD